MQRPTTTTDKANIAAKYCTSCSAVM